MGNVLEPVTSVVEQVNAGPPLQNLCLVNLERNVTRNVTGRQIHKVSLHRYMSPTDGFAFLAC